MFVPKVILDRNTSLRVQGQRQFKDNTEDSGRKFEDHTKDRRIRKEISPSI